MTINKEYDGQINTEEWLGYSASSAMIGRCFPALKNEQVTNNKQRSKLYDGLENVPAIQMAAAVPPNLNFKHLYTTGRHAP